MKKQYKGHLKMRERDKKSRKKQIWEGPRVKYGVSVQIKPPKNAGKFPPLVEGSLEDESDVALLAA